MAYTPNPTWQEYPSTATAITADALNHIEAGIVSAAPLTPTAVKTAAYTAVSGDLVRADATAGTVPITLPVAVVNATIAVKKVDTTANTVTVTPAGTDTIDGATPLTLRLAGETRTLIGQVGGWVVTSGAAAVAYDTDGVPYLTI